MSENDLVVSSFRGVDVNGINQELNTKDMEQA